MIARTVMVLLASFVAAAAAADNDLFNPLIDYDAFEKNVGMVGELRERRRITEADFNRMAADPATVIFDARSVQMFELLHVKGARNLSLPDVTEAELAKIIPSKDTRVLIYCNNNFLYSPAAFPPKEVSASLNVYTFNVLHSYGYRNVYELGPLIDIRDSKLPFEGTLAVDPS